MRYQFSEDHRADYPATLLCRVMQADGLKPKTRRPWRVITTDSKHQLPVTPHHLDQDFTADGPDQKWATDITCVATAEGWLYLVVTLLYDLDGVFSC